MEGKRLLRTLRLANFLSYGPEGTEIELQPLNVLIGPNGSGKSNLIAAISLLKAAPTDLSAPIRAGGGIPEWVWKGEDYETSESSENAVSIDIAIEATVSYRDSSPPLRYRFQLGQVGQSVRLISESLDDVEVPSTPVAKSHYSYSQGKGVLTTSTTHITAKTIGPVQRQLKEEDLVPGQSILSQRKDPDLYPELTYLGNLFSEICLFRSNNLGHASPLRGPQRADATSNFLSEDGSNLGMVLNDLLNRQQTKKRLLAELRRFYDPIEDITTRIHAGTVETLFHERGLSTSVPSIRLSDGTLRYLCLLTILCHPTPPPLVCIEDPELGLHPDILPIVAELLKEASQRTQLIVTTHSDDLVSALSDVPEAVIVCERDDGGTYLERLQPEALSEWLEKYSLGELWRMGEVGGNP